MKQLPKIDIFICHASEDKIEFVEPLAIEFQKLKVSLFYDKFSIELGDSILQKINNGLSITRFGIVVFSKNFFKKKWPKDELDGLYSRENDKKCQLIFIWHKCDEKLINKHYPAFALRKSLKTQDFSLQEIVIKILERIRPDYVEMFNKIFSYEKFLRYHQIHEGNSDEFKMPSHPIHHDLPKKLHNRIRLLRVALWDVDAHSYKYWYDSFRGEAHPTRELEAWEYIAMIFQEFKMNNKISSEQLSEIYQMIIHHTLGVDLTNESHFPTLPIKLKKKLILHITSKEPLNDLNDSFPYANMTVDQKKRNELLSQGYLEDFENSEIADKAKEYYLLHYKDLLEETVHFDEQSIVSFLIKNKFNPILVQNKQNQNDISNYVIIKDHCVIHLVIHKKIKGLQILSEYKISGFSPTIQLYNELISLSTNHFTKLLFKQNKKDWRLISKYVFFSFLDEVIKSELLTALNETSEIMKRAIKIINKNKNAL